MFNKKALIHKTPQSRNKRDGIAVVFLAFLSISTIFILYYTNEIMFVPSDLPKVYITCDHEISKNNYKECVIEVDFNPTIAEIRARGNAKARYDKKGYRIQLSQPKSYLEMRYDDDWQLFAMYNDYTYMKPKLAFDLWRSLEPTNPTAILPDSRYVNLFLNEDYRGVYLLAEKNDRKLFGLDSPKNDTDSSLIFQAQPYTFFREYDKNAWTQDLPDPENINIMDKILPELISFINNTSDDIFFDTKSGIFSIFDELNLIDFFIFNFFILHEDFWADNFFLVRNTSPSKFYMIPWDFDISFGQAGLSLLSATKNPELEIRAQNELYNRLLSNEEFMSNCKERWFNLRKDVWSEKEITDQIFENYESMKKSVELDNKMWYPKLDVKDYIKILINWIPDRLEFCDDYFSQF